MFIIKTLVVIITRTKKNYVDVSSLYLLFPFPSGHDGNLSSIASAKEIELLRKKEASQQLNVD